MGSDLPDMSGERGPLPLVVVELLDLLGFPCLSVGAHLRKIDRNRKNLSSKNTWST